MTPSEIALSLIAGMSLLATVLFSAVNTRQAARNTRAAEKSADSAQESLSIATRQLATSSAAQAESLRLAQAELQASVQAHVDALQPYIWADLRPRDDGGLMVFVLGNSGPTVGTDIHVAFDPPLEEFVPTDAATTAKAIEDRMRSGIKSLPPGRKISWNLSTVISYYKDKEPAGPAEVTLTITANGPAGPIQPLTYVCSLHDLAQQSARPAGIALVERAVNSTNDRVKELVRVVDAIRRKLPDTFEDE